MHTSPHITPPSLPPRLSLTGLVKLVLEDRASNLGEWSYPGFQALLGYRLACYSQGLRPGVLRRTVGGLQRRLQRRVARRYGIRIDRSATVGRRVRLIHQSAITIHPGTVIGDDCWLRQGATLGSAWASAAEAPTLGRDVRLGANVVIEGSTCVGDSVRIGPNCVVVEDVQDGMSVFPARCRVVIDQQPQ